MLVKSDIRYIIKRVIIGVLIALILSFISGIAKAETLDMWNYVPISSSGSIYNASWNNIDSTYTSAIPLQSGTNLFYLGWNEINSPSSDILTTGAYDISGVINVGAYNITSIQIDKSASCEIYSTTNGLETYNATGTAGLADYRMYNMGWRSFTCRGVDTKRLVFQISTYASNGNYIFAFGRYMNITRVSNSSQVVSSVDNVNQSINDNTPVSNNDVSGNANDWASNNTNSPVINQLVLMPVTLLNSFVNGLSSTCSTYSFGILFDTELTLPCINLSQKLGVVWTTIDIILSGVFIFIFGKRCVKIFNDFTNLRSGQIDSLYGGDN